MSGRKGPPNRVMHLFYGNLSQYLCSTFSLKYPLLNFNNITIKEILTISFTLFAVIDVVGSVPVLASLRSKMGGEIRSLQATIISGVLMISFLLMGQEFLNFLGLDVQSFAVAGSIVIFIIGLEMILGLEFFKPDNNPKSGSVVPIAFPLIAGSGTLTTVMSLRANYHVVNIFIAILINLVIIYAVLRSLKWIERVLGPNGMIVIRKFFGVILLAIAVKIFGSNLQQFGVTH